MSDMFCNTADYAIPKRTYRCDAGHEFSVFGDWITMAVDFSFADEANKSHKFNYCMVCFGRWAEQQWPLREAAAPSTIVADKSQLEVKP